MKTINGKIPIIFLLLLSIGILALSSCNKKQDIPSPITKDLDSLSIKLPIYKSNLNNNQKLSTYSIDINNVYTIKVYQNNLLLLDYTYKETDNKLKKSVFIDFNSSINIVYTVTNNVNRCFIKCGIDGNSDGILLLERKAKYSNYINLIGEDIIVYKDQTNQITNLTINKF